MSANINTLSPTPAVMCYSIFHFKPTLSQLLANRCVVPPTEETIHTVPRMEPYVGNEKPWTAAGFHLHPAWQHQPLPSLPPSLPPSSLLLDQWVQMRWTTAISFHLARITCINHPAGSALQSSSRRIRGAAHRSPTGCGHRSQFPPTYRDGEWICSRAMFTALKYSSNVKV